MKLWTPHHADSQVHLNFDPDYWKLDVFLIPEVRQFAVIPAGAKPKVENGAITFDGVTHVKQAVLHVVVALGPLLVMFNFEAQRHVDVSEPPPKNDKP